MTLPPVSERQIRPCLDLEGDSDCLFIKLLNCSKECFPDGEYRRGRPCPRHFTADEIWELIDQHNLIEQIPLSPNTAARIRAVIDKHKQEQQP